MIFFGGLRSWDSRPKDGKTKNAAKARTIDYIVILGTETLL
jgi:hypothetical protein